MSAIIDSGSTYAITSYIFDAFSRETVRIDALGNAVTNAYDTLGQRVAVSGATYPLTHGYDTAGRATALSTTRDGGVWDSTAWLYNVASGLITNKVYADDTTVSFSYDEASRPLRTTWARGAWREHAYNADGLLTATTYSDATPAVALAYDAFQRLAAASNAVAAYIYANDALGAVTNEMTIAGTNSYQIARQYDCSHRLTSLIIDGNPVFYGYDDENRLSIFSNDAFTVAYAYTPDGWDAGYTVTLTNGTILSRAVTRDPYRRGLVKTITNAVDGVPVNPLAYNYDLLNRVTSRNSDAFGYNARSEVSSAIIAPNHTNHYEYDNIGNNLWMSVNTATSLYTSNPLNQYTNIANGATLEPVYDLDGNMTWDGRFSYTWDAENRLTAVYSNSTCIVSNAYDHQSRRVLKITPTATHTFVYDGWNLAQETIATTSGVTTKRYVWGNDLSGTLQGAGGVGGLLAVSIDGQYYMPCIDNNGNIIAYIDETGTLVAMYVYDAFGCTIDKSGPMANDFRFRFSTKYFDSEPGLYYYGYRFYLPELSRWINRDRIDENGGVNLYEYNQNCPLVQVDFLGLDGVTIASPDFDGKVVHTIDDIVSTAKTSGGGGFRIKGVLIKRSLTGVICKIQIEVEITYNGSLPLSIEPGKATGYRKHITWDNRGLIINPERGAVLAHERGHAKGFMKHVVALKDTLQKFIGKRFVLTETIQSTYTDFVDNPTFQQSIADEANSATVEYFSGNGFAPIHPAIVPGYDGDIDYAWEKK